MHDPLLGGFQCRSGRSSNIISFLSAIVLFGHFWWAVASLCAPFLLASSDRFVVSLVGGCSRPPSLKIVPPFAAALWHRMSTFGDCTDVSAEKCPFLLWPSLSKLGAICFAVLCRYSTSMVNGSHHYCSAVLEPVLVSRSNCTFIFALRGRGSYFP